MDKDVLRRLGWSEELIDAMSNATKLAPARRAFDVGHSAISVRRGSVGDRMIDGSQSPVVASSVLPPPRAKR